MSLKLGNFEGNISRQAGTAAAGTARRRGYALATLKYVKEMNN